MLSNQIDTRNIALVIYHQFKKTYEIKFSIMYVK